jgi:hypothetical protein
MAQTGYTPIQIYYSTTTTNAPSAGNLLSGELAINITDGKMFYKDNGGSVQVIAWKTTPTTAGGTGLTSWTAGDLPYYSTGTTLTKLGIGTNGQVLTSTGTAPQWSTLSGVAVTTFSAGTTGLTPNTPTSGAITLGGTLATTNGGTGLTSFTANGVVYASSTSALTTGSALVFDGTNLGIGQSFPSARLEAQGVVLSKAAGNLGRFDAQDTNSGGAIITLNSALGVAGTPALQTQTNHPILFATNNVERMRLTSAGDVGIGTSSPGAKLSTVTQTTGTVAQFNTLLIPSGSTAIAIGGYGTTFSNTGVHIRAYTNHGSTTASSMAFEVNGTTEVARFDNAGNFGIGTSSPGFPLTVYKSQNTDTAAQIYNDNAGAAAQATFYVGNASATASSTFIGANGENLTPTGGFVADGGYIGTGTLLSGGLSIMTRANAAMRFYTNGHTNLRMTLDASGNLGLGVTPSAWNNIFRVMQLGTDGAWVGGRTDGQNQAWLGTNAWWNGSNWIYTAATTAGQFLIKGNEFQFLQAGTGSIGGTATFTQAMTLDADGDLGVGTTSPTTVSNYRAITVNGTNGGILDLKYGDTLGGRVVASSGGLSLETGGANVLTFYTNATERARITSGGNFGIGVTNPTQRLQVSDGTFSNFYVAPGYASGSGTLIGTGGSEYLAFATNGLANERARITSGGALLINRTAALGSELLSVNGTATATDFNSTSDRNKKTNITTIESAVEKVKRLRGVEFDWIADGKHSIGVIAQEVEEVIPSAVQGDEGNKTVSYGNLVGLLIEAIKEQQQVIDQLRSHINPIAE